MIDQPVPEPVDVPADLKGLDADTLRKAQADYTAALSRIIAYPAKSSPISGTLAGAMTRWPIRWGWVGATGSQLCGTGKTPTVSFGRSPRKRPSPERYGFCPSRVSQLKDQFRKSWNRLHNGEDAERSR